MVESFEIYLSNCFKEGNITVWQNATIRAIVALIQSSIGDLGKGQWHAGYFVSEEGLNYFQIHVLYNSYHFEVDIWQKDEVIDWFYKNHIIKDKMYGEDKDITEELKQAIRYMGY